MMRTDHYMRFMLTIIAICLIWLCVRDLQVVPSAFAQVDRGQTVLKVQIVSIDESPGLRWEPLPVTVR